MCVCPLGVSLVEWCLIVLARVCVCVVYAVGVRACCSLCFAASRVGLLPPECVCLMVSNRIEPHRADLGRFGSMDVSDECVVVKLYSSVVPCPLPWDALVTLLPLTELALFGLGSLLVGSLLRGLGLFSVIVYVWVCVCRRVYVACVFVDGCVCMCQHVCVWVCVCVDMCMCRHVYVCV
jgi:hypothetical protein